MYCVTSLAVAPAPFGPTWNTLAAMVSNRGRHFAKAASLAPTITVIEGGRPLTGASISSTPRDWQAAATRATVFGALVVRSIWAAPGCNPATTPDCGSNIADSNSAGPGNEVNTASLLRAAAEALSARTAPCAHRAAVASGRRS